MLGGAGDVLAFCFFEVFFVLVDEDDETGVMATARVRLLMSRSAARTWLRFFRGVMFERVETGILQKAKQVSKQCLETSQLEFLVFA